MTAVNFAEEVLAYVQAIPQRKVATYGQIAALAGSPRAARMVGAILAKSANSSVPWQRVINRHGMISIENMLVTKVEQAQRLSQEGVQVELREGNYFVDLATYLVDSSQLQQRVARLKQGQAHKPG